MAIQIDTSRYTNLDLQAHDDGVWVVTLNRPAKRNALDINTIDELVEFFSLAPRAGCSGCGFGGCGGPFLRGSGPD